MIRCVATFKSEKFKFEYEPPEKSQIKVQKSEKILMTFLTKDFTKSYFLFEKIIIYS